MGSRAFTSRCSGHALPKRVAPFIALLLAVLSPSCSEPLPWAPRASLHVTGAVLDRDGSALANVQLHYAAKFSTSSNDRRAFGGVVTDSAGSFALDVLEGPYEISLDFPWDLGIDRPFGYRTVNFKRSAPRLDIRLSGYEVVGSLIDPFGSPIDSGDVYAAAEDGSYSAFCRYRSGRYRFLIPTAGSYRFSAHPLDWYSGLPGRTLRAVPIDADTTIDFVLDGVQVSGTVFGPDGTPFEGATVAPITDDGSRARTSADGSYRLWVAPGAYRFRIDPSSTTRWIFPRVTALVDVAGPVTLDATFAGTRWIGTVHASGTGAPVESAAVTASLSYDPTYREARAATAIDGSFQLIVEPGFDYDLQVSPWRGTAWPSLTVGAVAAADTAFNFVVDLPAP